MENLNITFDGITDTTGYLFSLAKCFAAVVKDSEYKDYAEDIIAASGFAFRMWADSKELCPSATSIWDFKSQKQWFENSGLLCDYVERLWGEDAVEEERRLAAISLIQKSIDNGTAVVAWDISGCEWGIIIGYDEENQSLLTLKINGNQDSIPYDKLGKLDIPILSVVSICGKQEKSAEKVLSDTKKLAVAHLKGEEWCDNAKGLEAYDIIIDFVTNKISNETAWNLEYYMGTYGALKWYAWKFFEKYQEQELATLYQAVYEAWQEALDIKCSQDVTKQEVKEQLARLLTKAKHAEQEAVGLMEA